MGRRVRASRTLVGHIAAVVGFRRTASVLGYMVGWAMWVRLHGTAPTVDQLAGASSKTRAQWFRQQALFRECFPGERNPDRMVRIALDEFCSDDPEVLASMPLKWFGV